MSEEDMIINITVNLKDLERDINVHNKMVEDLKDNGEKVIEFVEKKSKFTFRNVVTAANATWSVINNFLQAFGVSISAQFRSMISMGISTITFLYPLLTAEMATPGMWAQGALGLANLVMAQMALTAAQMEQTNIANTTFQINQAFHSMHGIIGSLNFLG